MKGRALLTDSYTPRLADYIDKFPNAALRRDDGVLEITLHDGGDGLAWNTKVHEQLTVLVETIGRDPENLVVILTGSGDAFIGGESQTKSTVSAEAWALAYSEARRLMEGILSVEAPMIAAINGPATIHAELALLCDITLMARGAYLQDTPHLPNGLVPGDGVHVVWPLLLGFNRARYFLMTGQKIGAEDAQVLGLVNEVMDKESLLPRAHELATYLRTRPPVAMRLTRTALVHQVKKLMHDNLSLGLMLEGMGAMSYWPHAVGSTPTSAPGVNGPDESATAD
jgi:enoyl-CoA hydratase/carnithine racemase